MTKEVVTINSNETVFDACLLYRDKRVGCLVIIDNGFCIGIITERDLIERSICVRKDPEKTKISEIMSSEIKTINALETIEKATGIMKAHKIKKLPVTMNDKIVGIITISDIYKARPDISKRFIETWVKSKWRD